MAPGPPRNGDPAPERSRLAVLGVGSAVGGGLLAFGGMMAACGGVSYGCSAAHPLQAEGQLITLSFEGIGILLVLLGVGTLLAGGLVIALSVVFGAGRTRRPRA